MDVSKKVGHFHDQRQFRCGQACFPFVDGTHGDTQHFGQLLLGQAALFAESADGFGKFDLHSLFAPLSFVGPVTLL